MAGFQSQGHWGRVEIRNHWRRRLDGEDQSRSRNPWLLANTALITAPRSLQTLADPLQEQSLPEFRDNLRSRPKQCLAIIAKL